MKLPPKTLPTFRPHQGVRIKAGALSGAIGTVQEVKDGRYLVAVSGNHNGEPVHAENWYAASSLEAAL